MVCLLSEQQTFKNGTITSKLGETLRGGQYAFHFELNELNKIKVRKENELCMVSWNKWNVEFWFTLILSYLLLVSFYFSPSCGNCVPTDTAMKTQIIVEFIFTPRNICWKEFLLSSWGTEHIFSSFSSPNEYSNSFDLSPM